MRAVLARLLRPGLALAALAVLAAGPARGLPLTQQERALAPRSVLLDLRGAVGDLSRLGLEEEAWALRDVLLGLGDDPGELERLARTWERNLEREPAGASRLGPLARKLERQAALLDDRLAEVADPDRARLASLVLALDADAREANRSLGREHADGRWLTPEEHRRAESAAGVEAALQAAARLPIEVEVDTLGAGESPPGTEPSACRRGFDGPCNHARAAGVELHSPLPTAKLERILRQALRAAALSGALLGGELEVPGSISTTLVLADSAETYERALDEAQAAGALDEGELSLQRSAGRRRSFIDRRGWRTSRWRVEADFEAFVLWRAIGDWLGDDPQPALEAGHLNWLCLNLLGTSMPSVTWREALPGIDPARRSAVSEPEGVRPEPLWRAARRTFHGCRSWMEAQVRAGSDPPYERCLVDQVGRLADETLLKATLMAAYLKDTGTFVPLLESTRGAEERRVAAFERALGRPLPELDAAWRDWLLGTDRSGGLVQRLADLEPGQQDEETGHPQARAVIEELERLRAQAFGAGPREVEALVEDLELSRNAQAHADYLSRNLEQLEAWPDAHEEYPDREGFSPAGLRAGLSSVVYPERGPLEALDGWMATFYHRLPLLDPGLIAIGLGGNEDSTVLDVGSLVLEPWGEHWVVWPPDGAREVPRAFQPELPNPVPGEDQASWGYPVTLQLWLPSEDPREPRLDLALHRGSADGPEVACHRLTPTEYAFAELVPTNAWCLVPTATLAAGQDYTLVVTPRNGPEAGQPRSWSFTTAR